MKTIRAQLSLLLAGLVLLVAAQAATAAMPTIAAGGAHSCGVADSGAVFCWGENALGQLGDGTTTNSSIPVRVVGLPDTANGIAAGRDSTCAMLVNRSVYCWGGNTAGQLGDGTVDVLATPHPTPSLAVGVTNAASLSGGDRTFCFVSYTQTAYCWGANDDLEIGNPAASSPQPTAIAVDGLVEVRSVSVGYQHACAVINDGTADCWGDNTAGKLGDGTATPRAAPVRVQGLATVDSIFAGGATSCAVIGLGTASCWGAGGLIGNGSVAPSSSPKQATGVESAAMLGGSAVTNCAVHRGQSLACWGSRPGNGSAAPSTVPVAAATPPGVISVTGNGVAGHICLLVRGGSVLCWGEDNSAGELGNGQVSPAAVSTPAPVVGLDLVTGVYSSTKVTLTTSGRAKFDKRRRQLRQKLVLTAKLPMLIGPADGCSGRAGVATGYRYKKFKRVGGKLRRVTAKRTYRARAAFKFEGDSCVARASLKLPASRFAGRRIRATASWAGNPSIAPIKATSKRFGLPKRPKR